LGWSAGAVGEGGVGLGVLDSEDSLIDGASRAKDPTADAWFAISDSRSLAIALPAVVARSDLIAEVSGALAEPSSCEGAVGLSPLQPLASINTAARVIKRLERFCIMTPLLFELRLKDVTGSPRRTVAQGRHGAKAQQYL
jgi:hypothetical protein